MTITKLHSLQLMVARFLLGAGLIIPQIVRAHCDTMDGPVVLAAKTALVKRDIIPVLKWVKPDVEAEIRAAFAKTLTVRAQGSEARELADKFFFETLVRLHRAGEGAPFTGLKPAGTALGPAIKGADKALESGDIESVVKLITGEVAEGIHHRFAEVREKKPHADHNVEAGRAFVAAYIEYVHYVEGLHEMVQGAAMHAEERDGNIQSKDTVHERSEQHQH